MDNRTKYESNNDIEDILSETLSNGGGNTGLEVKKINSSSNLQNMGGGIQERLEISSNKDVNIGLDLLVNKDKKNIKRDPIEKNVNSSNTTGGFNLQSRPLKSNKDLVNDMLSNLDIEENTSGISQKDIDQLIDAADKQSKNEVKSLLQEKPVDPLNNLREHLNVDNTSVARSRYVNPQMLRPEESRRKKQEILFKLEKMRRLGVGGIKKFNMSNRLEEMESELARIKYERELESSIKFQRKCLMAFVTGSELLNNKFDFLDLKLDGWSEQVHDSVDEYNEVFEELHEKYSTKVQMAPEIKLLFMLGGSAFMYHLTNSMFKNSIPGMEDIMKQNPDLMKQFASAAINQMQGEEKQAAEIFNNFTPFNRTPPPPGPQMNTPFGQSSRSFTSPPQRTHVRQQMNMPPKRVESPKTTPTTGYVETSSSLPTATRISPPIGVDEILNELKSNNTDNDVEELLSGASSRKINVRRKKHKKKRKNIILNNPF